MHIELAAQENQDFRTVRLRTVIFSVSQTGEAFLLEEAHLMAEEEGETYMFIFNSQPEQIQFS